MKFILAPGRLHFHSNIVDPGLGGALTAPRHPGIDVVINPFGDTLDTAIAQVTNPAAKTVPQGFAPGTLAEKHTLHPTTDPDMHTLHRPTEGKGKTTALRPGTVKMSIVHRQARRFNGSSVLSPFQEGIFTGIKIPARSLPRGAEAGSKGYPASWGYHSIEKDKRPPSQDWKTLLGLFPLSPDRLWAPGCRLPVTVPFALNRTPEPYRRGPVEQRHATPSEAHASWSSPPNRADNWQTSSAAADFVARLSHELRTPLTAILGYSEMLCASTKTLLPPDQHRQLEIVERSGQAMLRLISDVLDWSQIEAGRVTPQASAFPVKATLEEYLDPLLPPAREKSLEVKLVVAGKDSSFVTDPDLLRQIFTNLVSNAVKYTDQGSITVSAECDAQHLKVSVEDTGPGIPAEEQAAVFEEFYRLAGNQKEGTGLGLPITRGLIEVLGGHLQLESQPGQGARFSFQLPCLTESTGTQEPPELPFPAHHEGARILIIDDNQDNRELLTRYLQDQGYHPILLENGDGAIESFLRHDPHLILMDLMMPGMDGFEATRRLRTIRTPEQLPIIAVTALSAKHDHDRALEAGCNACLVKPLNFKRLRQILRRSLAGMTA